jgi:hypothetical protein
MGSDHENGIVPDDCLPVGFLYDNAVYSRMVYYDYFCFAECYRFSVRSHSDKKETQE